MFADSAELYDLIYAEKDYAAEADYVQEAVRVRTPAAATLLDVACGTGRHAARFFGTHRMRTDGIDVNPTFVSIAQHTVPSGRFSVGDMTHFDLGRTYDAVVCLFSSVGYVKTVANLRHAITSMARHVGQSGVLVVEPWFEPGTLEDGHVTCITRDGPKGPVCRMSHTTIDGRTSRVQFEYLVGSPDGLARLSETHELGLFTHDEMTEAFHLAGLPNVAFDVMGPTGRGLFIASRT